MADGSPPLSAALPDGVVHLRHHLDDTAQQDLVNQILHAIGEEFWFQPTTPRWNRPFSVRMSNLGTLGWVSDRRGYRYQPGHPETGLPWPAMPLALPELWREVAGHPALPEACLVNLYRGTARMGLHQDRDEHDLSAPVVWGSRGATASGSIGDARKARAFCARAVPDNSRRPG